MITVESVTTTYGDFTAVDDVSFTAQQGRVTGFLGPNDAAKTTTCGSSSGSPRPTRGPLRSPGAAMSTCPTQAARSVSLLDASAQHAGRTGREILTITQRYMGLPRSRSRGEARPRQPYTQPRHPAGSATTSS
jgi:ABC-2 type transport system ATP-binding protein